GQIIADAIPEEVSGRLDGPQDEVLRTIADGTPRRFIEYGPPHPLGIRQFVIPLTRGRLVLGALVVEYTPIYDAVARLQRAQIITEGAVALGAIAILLFV